LSVLASGCSSKPPDQPKDYVGKIAAWKSLLTAALFVVAMFATFDVAFDVIMPKGPLEALIGR